jgi:hypothetical protein
MVPVWCPSFAQGLMNVSKSILWRYGMLNVLKITKSRFRLEDLFGFFFGQIDVDSCALEAVRLPNDQNHVVSHMKEHEHWFDAR